MAVGTTLADTSVFVAREHGRRLDRAAMPSDLAVSIITIAELRAGVLSASDVNTRAQRLDTFTRVLIYDPLPIDEPVAEAWAELRTRLHAKGRRLPINDSWIAATALAHGLAIVTQDDDYDVVDGLTIIKV